MEKGVYIKVNGDNGTSPAQFQRNLFQRQQEYQSTLFMADGRPAGSLWLDELDDLVVTKRYQSLNECNRTKHLAQHM